MDLRTTPGFLGTNATMLADITLIAYILILLPLMAVGFLYASRKRFEPQHKTVMTTITVLNWILILYVMVVSFSQSVAPNIPDNLNQNFILIPAVHATTGIIAQLLATYLMARMWLENQLPNWVKIKNIKIYMRVTLSLWIITALLGITTYVIWYGVGTSQANPSPMATDEVQPISTDEPVDNVPITEEAAAPIATDEPIDDDAVTEPVTTDEPNNPIATDDVEEPVTTPETSG